MNTGDVVAAWVNGDSCGYTSVDADGNWLIYIEHDGACDPDDGDRINYTLNAAAATESSIWVAGGQPDDIANGITLTPMSTTPYTAYGTGLVPGDSVAIFSHGPTCWSTTVDADGNWLIYVEDVPIACHVFAGDVLRFQVNGQRALETVSFTPGGAPPDVASGITLTIPAPPPPFTAYGTGLSSGATVRALVGGVECGNTVTDADGNWLVYVSEQDACAPEEGDQIHFQVSGVPATPSGVFVSGGSPPDIAYGFSLRPVLESVTVAGNLLSTSFAPAQILRTSVTASTASAEVSILVTAGYDAAVALVEPLEFAGGSTADLLNQYSACAVSFVAINGDAFTSYIIDAPSFVNGAWDTHFSDGIPADAVIFCGSPFEGIQPGNSGDFALDYGRNYVAAAALDGDAFAEVAVLIEVTRFAPPPPPPPASGGGGGGGFAPPAPSPTPKPTPISEAGGIEVEVEKTEEATITSETSATVTVSANNGSTARIDVPAGALPAGGKVTVSPVADPATLVEDAAPPATADLALGFVIQATDASGKQVTAGFASPVELEFTLPTNQLPAGTTAGQIVLAFWNGTQWVEVDATISTTPDGSFVVSASVDHFTLFGVMTSETWGTFSPTPGSRGITVTAWQGGGMSRLESAVGRGTVWASAGGQLVGYIPGAPTVVNRAFRDLFPNGVPEGSPLVVVR